MGASAAFYMAARLSFVYLRHWRKDRRRHVMSHVFFLTLALGVTSGLIVYTISEATGQNAPLSWWEGARMAQVSLICVGLRPLWVHHRLLTVRRGDQS